MSKVQNSQPEITKDEVQSTIKILHAHKCYDPAGLKNEVFKSGGDSFLNLITKMLNCILKENKETIKQLTNILSKIFEKIVHSRIHNNISNYVSPFQAGSNKN